MLPVTMIPQTYFFLDQTLLRYTFRKSKIHWEGGGLSAFGMNFYQGQHA